MSFVKAPSANRVQTKTTEFTVRSLRVRQRYLHDIGLIIDSVSGSQRLVFTIFMLWISPLGLSHWLIISKPQMQSRYDLSASRAVGPAVMVVGYLLMFAHLCILSQLIEKERTSLREAAQTFLLCEGILRDHRDEVEMLIAQIRSQENSRSACVLGMYNFDVSTLKEVSFSYQLNRMCFYVVHEFCFPLPIKLERGSSLPIVFFTDAEYYNNIRSGHVTV
ncbi:Extended synaptotagmin-3 [Frankliniella fusca]|uniref:Extended synaptotagmin-3 n=1 Tax=Frankliniella fusca TaxID=407009 RepID=A0AAE1LQ24_9NEOP|nr:Extended synaptotagmin-3 [Frankliniella fusca]